MISPTDANDRLKRKEQSSELCSMEMHDDIDLGRGLVVLRVPGGWIYSALAQNDTLAVMTATFVPYIELTGAHSD